MQHLDEGTIHAWLDGQLPREEALEVETHVAECRPCADAVAEARGLIAASSRILTALDGVPRDVVPRTAPTSAVPPSSAAPADPAPTVMPITTAPNARAGSRPRRRWFTGVTLAAAATIVVAIGTTMLSRAGKQPFPNVSTDEAVATAPRAAASGDSATAAAPSPTVAVVASPPAPESRGALGATVAPAPQRFAAGAGNEARDRQALEEKKSGARALADVARDEAAPVARAKVTEPIDAAARAKPGVDLAKDSRAERAQSAALVVASPKLSIRGNTTVRRDSTAVVAQGTPAPVPAPPPAAPAPAGSVHGRITDANNTGLSGAMVTVAGTTTGVVTNAAGEYTLGGLTSGSHRLLVRRIGYDTASREVTVAAGQTGTLDVVLRPQQTMLSEVVTTAAPETRRNAPAAKSAAARDRGAALETPPGAPITATQSNAIGCYELGITPTAASRNGFRQMPRQIALDAEIVPANADGVWYRARDLARTGALPNGLWRPSAPDALEIEWTYGSKTARVRVAGLAGSMMRGTLEEIDRATATGEAGTVVAIRRACAP